MLKIIHHIGLRVESNSVSKWILMYICIAFWDKSWSLDRSVPNSNLVNYTINSMHDYQFVIEVGQYTLRIFMSFHSNSLLTDTNYSNVLGTLKVQPQTNGRTISTFLFSRTFLSYTIYLSVTPPLPFLHFPKGENTFTLERQRKNLYQVGWCSHEAPVMYRKVAHSNLHRETSDVMRYFTQTLRVTANVIFIRSRPFPSRSFPNNHKSP
jgi:hypothetical protein